MSDKTGGPAFPGFESDNISLTPRERQIYMSAYSRGIIDGQQEALKRMSEIELTKPVQMVIQEKEKEQRETEGIKE